MRPLAWVSLSLCLLRSCISGRRHALRWSYLLYLLLGFEELYIIYLIWLFGCVDLGVEYIRICILVPSLQGNLMGIYLRHNQSGTAYGVERTISMAETSYQGVIVGS